MRKTNIKRFIVVFFLALTSIFLYSHLDIEISLKSPVIANADEAMTVYINGQKTDIICEKKGEVYLLPLKLPFEDGENDWEVVISYDKDSKRVEVEKKHHPIEELLSTRSDSEDVLCSHCEGTKDCKICWPEGSGYSDYSGSPPCDCCSGTGDCWYCGGTGKW